MMVRRWVGLGVLAAAALALPGCAGLGSSGTGNGPGMNVFWGNAQPEAAALPPPTPGPLPAPAPVAMGSFLEGPVGARLIQADRAAAFKAVSQALDTGNRQTWRGQKGVFGYVVPGAPDASLAGAAPAGAAPGQCRSFTATIYFAGRPQTGHGTGCQDPDGNWRVVS